MIPHLPAWVWLVALIVFWSAGVGFALVLGAVASQAEDQAARMYLDRCPDELEP
jgi:hypothetical protein